MEPEVPKNVASRVRFEPSETFLEQSAGKSDEKDLPDENGRSKLRMGSWIFQSVGGFYMPTEDVTKLSLPQQERLIIRELIYAFSGVPSTHIRPEISMDEIAQLKPDQIDKVRFKIDEHFSGAFRTLANELLPLIGYYISVQSFIEDANMSPGAGRSLGLALQGTMQQYFEMQSALETQLERRKLNLQQLVQQLRPWLRTMETLATLTCRLRTMKLNTAQLLSAMDEHQEHFQCDQLKQLVTDVAHHYMKLVQLWTQKGIIYDVRREFFVEDTSARDMSSTLLSPKQCCHAYWLRRYRLHLQRLPSFLEPLLEPIFLAGKYLNVLRQCNVEMQLMQASLSYVPGETGHVDLIRSSYELPARKLLELLVQQQQLLQHLANLGAYFLLQEPSLIQSLLANWSEELKPEQLQKLLMQSLHPSPDPHKHLLRCQLMNCAVTTQLEKRLKSKSSRQATNLSEGEASSDTDASSETAAQLDLCVHEAFALRYEPKWPISLVIHEEPLEQLQLLHRVLFYLHYVQHQLRPTCLAAPGERAPAWTLLQRMSDCIQQLEQHMAADIVQPLWQALMQLAEKAELVDELLNQFEDTLDQCLLLCLLSEPVTFVRSLYTLGQLCLNYNSFLTDSVDGTNFDSNVAEYGDEFNGLLSGILELITELAKPNGIRSNQECEACNQLLRRLEPIANDLGESAAFTEN